MNHNTKTSLDKEIAIEFSNATLTWDVVDAAALILQNVNVKIPKGKLTIVVGEVGSGKTALVSALLNEMHIKSVSNLFSERHDMQLMEPNLMNFASQDLARITKNLKSS